MADAKFVTKECTVAKVDAGQGIVYGWAFICKVNGVDHIDSDNDIITEECMLDCAYHFAKNSSNRVMLDMHSGEPIGHFPYIFPLTDEFKAQFGITCEKSGLLVGAKPDDDLVIEQFKSGERTGFSIGFYIYGSEEV